MNNPQGNMSSKSPLWTRGLCKWIGFLLMWTVALSLASRSLTAQDFTGFRGVITDPSGAIVSNVAVKATEERTGLSYSTITNEVGEYELRGVAPGTYTLDAELVGFKKYQNTGVIVYARDVRRVNVKLELGEVTESLTVEEQGARIQTDTAALTYKEPNRAIYFINRPGFLVAALGVNPGSDGARWQVNGGYSNNTSTEQDGVLGNLRASQEFLKEVSQISVNAPAEYRTAATVVGVGKNGTNGLHGEVFLNLAHPALNALPVGVKTRPKPEVGQKNWSFETSGPVYIPKVYNGKNKTFFYFLYQPSALPVRRFIDSFVVPTQRLRQGDLSEFVQATGRRIIDPFTGQPFPNDIIPEALISPIGKKLLNLLPQPNAGPPGALFRNYTTFRNDVDNRYSIRLRFDHQLTKSNTLSFTHLNLQLDQNEDFEGALLGNLQLFLTRRAYSIQDSHTFSPRLLNEFIFTTLKQHQLNTKNGQHMLGGAPGPIDGRALLQAVGMTNLGGRQVPSVLGGFPYFEVQTIGDQTGALAGAFNPIPANLLGVSEERGVGDIDESRFFQIRDSLSWQVGHHLFKMGGELRYNRPDNLSVELRAWGRYAFTGQFTGYDVADLLLGLPFSTSIESPRGVIQNRHRELGFFVQDDWKITPKLTLTPGLRMQRYGEPYDGTGLYYNFDVQNLRVVVPDDKALAAVSPAFPKTVPVVTAAQAGYPERLVNFKSMLFEPRFGLAWRPFGEKFVVRTGYGVYHVPFSASVGDIPGNLGHGFVPGRTGGPFQLREDFGPNQIINGVPQLTLARPFPTEPGRVGLQNVSSLPLDSRKNDWPYDQQWNLTLERELPKGFSVRAAYVGSKGTHWPYTRDLQIPPASTIPFTPARRTFGSDIYSSINLFDLGGNSTYHAMQLELAREFSKGLYLRGWYEWKKALNDVQGGLFGTTTGATIEDPYDRSREKGYQDGFSNHVARFTPVYDLPVGKGRHFLSNAPGWLTHVVGNWTMSSVVTYRGNSRFTPVFSGSSPSNTGRSGGRPDQLCDPNNVGPTPGILWDRKCFAVPPNGRYGNASRGMLYGPRIWGTDFFMFKQWFLTGNENGPYFKVELYATNVFNHSNTGGPSSLNISSAAFGRWDVTSSDIRRIAFRLRVGF